ncbi:MAG: D-alanyl-D-alanine carboxypeptidase [Alphaproteobacteria bacterium]|nr:D-alanyl-D-alanine carboxypeptidase [Alphaproteobacteria bacterium]PPR12717.1 MAG: D-alanyl-D-alanine carboxypeptidase DacC [Alphaproteobacteria bacterium MarineAlpha12_Bin1]|tara:strand:- start:2863 stop:4035 length:1173 start_codon:yes stop_codon:yes gene_type:complete
MTLKAFLITKLIITFVIVITSTNNVLAASFVTNAKHAILIDYNTDTVLFEKQADEKMFPASMSKIMTALLVFDRLKEGILELDTKLLVSEKAWRMGGSKMFVRVGDEVSVRDLLRGVIVQSGNDASIVFAEAIGGTEAEFAELMTNRAKQIGLKNTTFKNATGWPDSQHVTTARDLALLAKYVIKEYPQFYKYYSEKKFSYGKSNNGKLITQNNRNPLLYQNIGADGLKTGHIKSAGYGLTASGIRNDRRLIIVVHGLKSARIRAQESRRLFDWGFREFTNIKLFSKSETVDEAQLWLGKKNTVSLKLKDDLILALPKASLKSMKVNIKYMGPVPTPVKENQEIAILEVTGNGFIDIRRPLYAGETVDKLGLIARLFSALKFIILGASDN